MQKNNRQFRLAARPFGLPKRTDWAVTDIPVSEPGEGQLLAEVMYISLDPAMRGWMDDRKSYLPPLAIGEVMRAGAVGKVIASKNARFREGDYVYGSLGVQQYAVSDGKGLTKVDATLMPLTKYLGVLGIAGLTAYFGLLDICSPKAGETLVVSGAAGAVGEITAQIGKIKGCRVVGIAGGPEKCQYLADTLGLDAVIDYKNENVRKALKAACPNGIDIYFDNVGGEILNEVLAQINFKARISLCGAISQYNATEMPKGLSNYGSLIINRAKMEGFIVFDYAARYMEAIGELAGWMSQGKLHTREHIEEGIDHFPEVFLKLFSGENHGKLILKV
ncbi:MAG: NADP-dependent oxidoreductase [Bacteroidia bacterium]